MKKIFAIALVLVLALSLLTACGGKGNIGTGSTGGQENKALVRVRSVETNKPNVAYTPPPSITSSGSTKAAIL